ncbi:MAG: hypothetical protein JWM59_2889 [Verrucomicrobiales bacterium]|nr:hypothetical protein [Verrucomicrobiales bacterium]
MRNSIPRRSAFRLTLSLLALPALPALAVDATTVFNEVMYHPADANGAEWIELYNQMAVNMDLAGWRISGGVNYTFPAGTTIPAGGYLLISANPSALQAAAGISGVLGPWTGQLSNGNETITLRNRIDRVMDEFSYRDTGDFPVGADGGGVALAKRQKNSASGEAANWTLSGVVGGTPAGENFPAAGLPGPLVTLSDYGAAWKYMETGADLGANWAQTTYAAGTGGWKEGRGVLAAAEGLPEIPVGTFLAKPGSGVVTHYFQRAFSFAGDPARTVLQLNTLLDDGAVVYLNGTEVARTGMPEGAVTAGTAASAFVDKAAVAGPLTLPSTALVAGTNVLSVEVHQYPDIPPTPETPDSGDTVQTTGGLTLAQLGGSLGTGQNLALTANGGSPFAKDVLTGYPAHSIPHLNDGIYGNSNSWIGGSLNSFCGIRLSAAPVTVGSIAWGRDQTGASSDRSAGTYTVQYTVAANPGATTPENAWTTLGTVTYTATALGFPIQQRHRFNFPPVQATGVRLVCPGNGLGSGTCVDELELYAAPWNGSDAFAADAGTGFHLARTGGDGPAGAVPDNFARASNGAVAFGSSELHELASGAYRYNIADVNDGFYGNNNSWVSAGGEDPFIGVRFAGTVALGRVAWGRDNAGNLTDRSLGTYTLQYTSVAVPGTATAETGDAATGWRTIGTVRIAGSDSAFSQSKRHEFAVSGADGAPLQATGLRIKVSDPAICIDELEASAPPLRDVVFGAQLVARETLPPAGDPTLVINEISGSGDTAWRLELRNQGTAPLSVGGVAVASSSAAGGGGYTLPAQTLAPGGLLVLDESQLGFRPPLDGRVFLYAAGRGQMLDAVVVKAFPRARLGNEFLTPAAATFGAENTFSLKRDVVINEIMYNAPLLPGSPPVSNPEEWLELYNKGTAAVDLGGWTLDDGISWTFPANTVLEAGGYLVIAKDAAALKAKWPEQAARIVGNFSGSLSNDGERVALLDAAGNPASEVHYRTGGAWPELPDGGGASLELRDARADLSNGASWAEGRPLAASDWQTVTYTMPSTQKFGQTQWNEFRFGMLDAGECLIDDVSVVRVSSGQQLIQGGDFESLATKWRMLGNHGASAVEEEPGNSGNHVLHVRSTGPFAFNHNHIETTWKGASLNTPLVEGQSYTVTFRTKWLGGCNLLNSRGYYSRLAATTALTIPTRLGSPGRVNATAAANIGPALAGLSHAPVIPAANAPVTVTVRAQDPDGLGAVNLYYALNGGTTFTTVPMTTVDGGFYTGVIPGQAAKALVQFYVEAADSAGAISALPASGPASRALYVVNDGVGTALGAHEFRVLMLPADRTGLLATVNRLSDGRIGGTVVYQRNEMFYDIGVRLQGTAAGRIRDGDLYTGFDVGFHSDQLFRGVHDSVNIDRSGRSPTAGGRDEIYVKHMFHRAGLPCTYDDLIYFVAPTPTYTGTAILQMAGYEKTFVDSQYDGAEGTVFNLEVTYEPSTTSVAGNVESLKNPVPLATQLAADFTDLGNDKEQYRGQLEPRAGRKYDDYTGLIAFCKAMSQTSTANLSTQVAARMDVDEWMRCAALYSLCGLEDCYLTGGFQHNLRLWVPRDGTGIQVLPWDMDFVFYKAPTTPALVAGGNLLRFINANGAAKRAYYGHLQDLCNTVFNSAYMTPWLTHYGKVAGQSMAGQASYINSRRNYLMAAARLPAAVPFAITTNGGADFTVDTPSATLAGTGWINVRTFRRADTGEILDAVWTTDKAWQLTLPLKAGANLLTLQALDFQGVQIAEKTITITSTGAVPLPVDFLRVTELMYHPSNPSPAELAVSADAEDFEFIELRNTGSLPLDISGCGFTAGVDFTFTASTVLAAGENILVVRNPAAFQARYGAAARVGGTYGPGDSLRNSGETLTLTDASGRVIQSFTYSDTAPWPQSADGEGRSLVLIAPQLSVAAADWNLASGWRASMTSGGNPDGSDTASPFTGNPTADADGDGLSALLEFALGTSDSVPDTGSATQLTRDAGGLLFTFPRAANADSLAYTIETSPDFAQWTPAAGAVLASSVPSGNGLMQTWRLPAPEAVRLFVRLKAAPR